MTFETLLNDEENQVRGFTYVLDEKAICWSQLSLWTPSEISKAFSCCERALPMRHKEIHLINLPWTMNLIFQFAKGLLSGKIQKRLQSHSGLDSLAKEVNQKILPSEYGGNRSTRECIDLWKAELEKSRSSLLELDSLKVTGVSQHDNWKNFKRANSFKDSCDCLWIFIFFFTVNEDKL